MHYNCFTQVNCSFTQNDKRNEKSNFDAILEQKWIEAQKNKIFRYILNIKESKILKGKYHFLIQVIFKII